MSSSLNFSIKINFQFQAVNLNKFQDINIKEKIVDDEDQNLIQLALINIKQSVKIIVVIMHLQILLIIESIF